MTESLPDIINRLLIEPFSLPFMQRALVASILIAIMAGVLGSYVVIKGMAFLTDALAHAVLPGIAIAYLNGGLGGRLVEGALIAGGLGALGIGFLTRGGKVKEDTAIGIVFTTLLALGLAIMSVRRSANDLTHILVGNILAVSDHDLTVIAVAVIVVLALTLAFYKELLLNAFDPALARALRLPSEALRYLLLLMLAATIVVSIQVVGVMLISAMLITPAAAAYFLTRRLHVMMLLAALIGVGGSIVGLLLAWHLNISPSAAVVVTISSVFLLAFLFAPGRGLLRARAQEAATAEG